ncbi:MAG: indolepyruvate oxidoreductase subunit beta [Bacillota bacterium]
MNNNYNILICGVGGQGTLLASKILGEYALLKGMDAKLSEVHGMSQRGGSVVTYVKIGEKINSPILFTKQADIIMSFETLEALRYAEILKDDGVILYNSQRIMPMTVVSGVCEYPSDIEAQIQSKTPNVLKIDAFDLAKQAGNELTANTVMIGALAKSLQLDKDVMLEAIKNLVKPKIYQVNEKAFMLGYNV